MSSRAASMRNQRVVLKRPSPLGLTEEVDMLKIHVAGENAIAVRILRRPQREIEIMSELHYKQPILLLLLTEIARKNARNRTKTFSNRIFLD